MDIQKYVEKKEKGLVEILGIGKAHALVSRRFDSETGTELDPEIITLDVEELRKQRETLAAQVAAIDALLADLPVRDVPAQ